MSWITVADVVLVVLILAVLIGIPLMFCYFETNDERDRRECVERGGRVEQYYGSRPVWHCLGDNEDEME